MEITREKLLEQIAIAERSKQEAVERLGFSNGVLGAFRSMLKELETPAPQPAPEASTEEGPPEAA